MNSFKIEVKSVVVYVRGMDPIEIHHFDHGGIETMSDFTDRINRNEPTRQEFLRLDLPSYPFYKELYIRIDDIIRVDWKYKSINENEQ